MTPETFFEQFAIFAEAPNGVAKLRELILQLAVQGKLVPQDVNDEPASVLRSMILANRKRLIESGEFTRRLQPTPNGPMALCHIRCRTAGSGFGLASLVAFLAVAHRPKTAPSFGMAKFLGSARRT
jgi:hypothetical protein